MCTVTASVWDRVPNINFSRSHHHHNIDEVFEAGYNWDKGERIWEENKCNTKNTSKRLSVSQSLDIARAKRDTEPLLVLHKEMKHKRQTNETRYGRGGVVSERGGNKKKCLAANSKSERGKWESTRG